MVCDIAVIGRLAQISQDEQIKIRFILERSTAELEHLLVAILCNLAANQTFNMHINILVHIFHKHDLAHIDG